VTSDDDGAQAGDADVETEPDYRFTLANERTFLAWERTSLGLLAAAVAIVQFVPQFGIPGARHLFGGFLMILALLSAGFGLRRWRQVNRAMRRSEPLPPNTAPMVLGLGLVVLAVLALAAVVIMAAIK
jgi:putative membrane protein